MDPVKVAHSLSEPRRYAKSNGRCARCAAPGNLTPTREVVSPTFTGFEGWIGPAGGLCPSCVWLYRTATLRTLPHLVTQAPTFAAQSLDAIFVLLATSALRPTAAVSVPLRPGRKHLFAHVQWGTVRTDDANLTWSAMDAGRLLAVKRLRGLGFSGAQITSPAPAYEVLRRQPADLWHDVQLLWDALDPWRSTTHWLALALKIT